MMAANGWNPVELRDNRYNQIIHMVTAANGAEDFYTTEVQTAAKVDTRSVRKVPDFFVLKT